MADTHSKKDNLKNSLGNHGNNYYWDKAKLIYTECKNKHYLGRFHTQTEFGEYLGITKSTFSMYKSSYDYYLKYSDILNIRFMTVNQVYELYRVAGNDLRDFNEWVENRYGLNEIWFGDRDSYHRQYKEYLSQKTKEKSIELKTFHPDVRITEDTLLYYYRMGTSKQKEQIDSVIREIMLQNQL